MFYDHRNGYIQLYQLNVARHTKAYYMELLGKVLVYCWHADIDVTCVDYTWQITFTIQAQNKIQKSSSWWLHGCNLYHTKYVNNDLRHKWLKD